MFAPFLERMAASLPYYKGLQIRRSAAWPKLEAWFLAMEARPSYRHIQSDFYTHVHDLPPQVSVHARRCASGPPGAPRSPPHQARHPTKLATPPSSPPHQARHPTKLSTPLLLPASGWALPVDGRR